jgi:hypothetical protein
MTPSDDDLVFSFDFGDGTASVENEVEHVYEKDGTYSLKLTAHKEFCAFEETVQIPIYKILIPNVITPEATPGYNDDFQIVFGADLIPPADIGLTIRLSVFNRWGKKVFESSDYRNNWNANGLVPGVYYMHVEVGDLTTCKGWIQILK